jgi:hypothetical protein
LSSSSATMRSRIFAPAATAAVAKYTQR